MTISKLSIVALASTMLMGGVASASADGVTPPDDGHTPREEWREAAIVDEAVAPPTDGHTAGEEWPEEALASEAYFVVNLHYCNPPATMLVDTRPVPTGDAAIVYETVLMGAYGGDCDEFYAKEVRPRVYLSDDQS